VLDDSGFEKIVDMKDADRNGAVRMLYDE
jgi:hypothetical protein